MLLSKSFEIDECLLFTNTNNNRILTAYNISKTKYYLLCNSSPM